MRIYKYIIDPPKTGTLFSIVRMPLDARILHVHSQHGKMCLWAEVPERSNGVEDKVFEVYPTGIRFTKEKKRYIGTCHFYSGEEVYHIYEVLQRY